MARKSRKPAERGERIPAAFLDRIQAQLRSDDELSAFVEACSRPLPTCLRQNPLRAGGEGIEEVLAERGLAFERLDLPAGALKLGGGGPDPGKLLEHALGLFYLQEWASMLPVEALRRARPEPIGAALDLCAAPGSKTTQLGALLAPDGFLLANEPNGSRAKVLVANLLRCGLGRALVTTLDGRQLGHALEARFDAVLVDAPCSGEGTIRKDREALRHFDDEAAARCAATQIELLLAGYRALAPGGLLVYSTCTLAPAENGAVVDRLRDETDAELVDLGPLFPELARSRDERGRLLVFPHHYDSGGFFVALLRKPGVGAPTQALDAAPPHPIEGELERRFGIILGDLGLAVSERGGTLRATPRHALDIGASLRRSGLSLARAGFQLGTATEPHHELALAVGSSFELGLVEIDRDEARRFLAGLVLECEIPEEPTLLRYDGLPIGWARGRGKRCIGLLPKHAIRPSL